MTTVSWRAAASEEPQELPFVTCPFLSSVDGQLEKTYPHGVQCALRRGPARAPSTDELAWFCTNGRHHACTTYRRCRRTGGM